jgi:hypothetical protein
MNISAEEHRLKLHGISISGLHVHDRELIAKHGFDAWLSGRIPKTPAVPQSKADIPSGKRCALAGKCLRSYKRQGAHVREGNGLYCSAGCRATAQALKKRARDQWAAANPGMAEIQPLETA